MSESPEAATRGQGAGPASEARPPLRAVVGIFAAAAAIAGGLSWALGLWLAWDVMGETTRHAITFLVGGAVSALLIALHVHWRIVPLLRVTATIAVGIVGTLAGLVCAILVVRHLLLYAAGAAPWWPVVACAAAFVCVALCVAVPLISLAALATLLVRNTRAGRAPLRGGAILLIAVVAGPAILAGLLYSPSGYYTSLWHLVHAPRHSLWYDAREELFSEVLTGHACDVLVVPLEAPVHSIDRVGRDLIARTLAATIGEQTGLCVVDFDLARRALGEQRRQIAWDSVYRLADRVGARSIVRGTASTTPDARSSFLELTAYRREVASGSAWQTAGSVRFPRQAVSDELPPELPYLRLLDTVPPQLGFTARPAANAPSIDAIRTLPATPEGLLVDSGSAIDRAERLQLLAATLAEYQPEAESLWIRSLVALRHAPATDDDANALKARAWLYLARRPYAEHLVMEAKTPEALAVRELARGNLAGSAGAAGGLRAPVARILDEIGVEWMRVAYGDFDGYEHRRDTVAKRHPAYLPFFHQAYGGGDWGSSQSMWLAQEELQRRGVVIEDPLERELLRAVVRRVLPIDPFVLAPSDPASLAEASYAPLWRARASQWRTAAHDRLAERDLFEVLFALNRQAADRNLELRLQKQGLYQRAVDEAMAMSPALRANPLILSRTLVAIRWAATKSENLANNTWSGAAFEFAKHLIAAEDGETGTALQISQQQGLDSPWSDVPVRPYRAAGGWAEAKRVPHSAADAEILLARNRRAALLARTGFGYVSQAEHYLRSLGRSDEADLWMAANADRFDGDPARTNFELWKISTLPDPEQRLAALMVRVNGGTSTWGYFRDAAIAQLQLHRPDEAQRVMDAWPAFRADDASPIVSGNYREASSRLFMNAGETARAQHQAELSVAYRTGSWADFVSRSRLAVIAHDWDAARVAERGNVERYDDNESRARSAWFAFVAGAPGEGTSEAIEAVNRGSGLAIRALVTGARIAGADPQAWLADVTNRIDRNRHTGDVPWRLALELLWIDRPIDAATLEPVLARARTAAQGSTLLLKSYAAFRNRDWKGLMEWSPRLYGSPVDAAGNVNHATSIALPYHVIALVRNGLVEDAAAIASRHRELTRAGHYYAMSQAVIDEARGQRGGALERLWQSFVDIEVNHYDPIHMAYLLFEIAELLYEETRDERYRDLLADMAARYARAWPISWAYGFAARYGKTADVRREAATALLYLDAQSMRLNTLPAAEIEQARKQLEQRNPLLARP